jgi:lipoprotein-anchoring transpeptidase ErfK/SrfK
MDRFYQLSLVPGDQVRHRLVDYLLSGKRYGIHGTNRPDSIGRYASHGCIRLRNADITALYEITPVGTQVTIINGRL